MAALSAGILMYRRRDGALEVLLVHFGGPYWQHKDAGAWSMPKGLVEDGEDPATAARREFEEELGVRPDGALAPLGRIRQSGGKWVEAFALEGDLDADAIVSNEFTLEWPPRSGRMQAFPEVDRARWYDMATAAEMILPSQRPLLTALEAATKRTPGTA